MSHRNYSLKPLRPATTVLGFEDVELLEESARPLLRRFPPAISDAELVRLVDECAAELCTPRCYDAYVY